MSKIIDKHVKFYVVILLFVSKESLKDPSNKIESKSITKKCSANNAREALSLVKDNLIQKGIYPDGKKYMLFFNSIIPITDNDICTFLNLNPSKDNVLHNNQ